MLKQQKWSVYRKRDRVRWVICQTYITCGGASKGNYGLCVRSHGKLKRKGGEVLK